MGCNYAKYKTEVSSFVDLFLRKTTIIGHVNSIVVAYMFILNFCFYDSNLLSHSNLKTKLKLTVCSLVFCDTLTSYVNFLT